MKRTTLINADLSRVVAAMGHGDILVIGDAGLPVPKGIERIDLAVSPGVPRFIDVLDAVLSELQVEQAVMASEAPGAMLTEIATRLNVEAVAHEEFKKMCRFAVAIVRTGEVVPYSNIGLIAGVTF